MLHEDGWSKCLAEEPSDHADFAAVFTTNTIGKQPRMNK
jgi:hypothetical protein